MKMIQEHFNLLKWRINNVLRENKDLVNDYEEGRFERSERVKDLNKRFRWDLWYRVVNPSDIRIFCEYLHDAHIDTALKKICPTIVKKY